MYLQDIVASLKFGMEVVFNFSFTRELSNAILLAMVCWFPIFPFLKIDQDTLQDVINLGYDKDHVCESLCNRLQNEVYANKNQQLISIQLFNN
jgi:hypothetical protein